MESLRCSYNCIVTPSKDEYHSPTQTKCQHQKFAAYISIFGENGEEWKKKKNLSKYFFCIIVLTTTTSHDNWTVHRTDRIHLLMDSDVHFAAK